MDAGTQAIYEELRRVVKAGVTTYYSDIAPLAGLDMDSPGDRARMARILGDISTEEHHLGRPLLSAIVVSKQGGSPGKGFFDLAKGMGLYDGGDDDRFWVQELQRVHACWSSR